MPSLARKAPSEVAGGSRKEAARGRFIYAYNNLIRGKPTTEDVVAAEAAFELWWTTGMAGGKYVPIPEDQ